MSLPNQYQYLTKEPGPKMLLEALKLYGVQEKSGTGNNPTILEWAKECGIKGYNVDSIPWCGLFMAIIAHRAGKPLPKNPLWARDWLNWGVVSPVPSLGDTLIFTREGGGGHVGLYVGEDALYYHVLGGNQGDAVNIKRIAKSRLLGAAQLYKNKPNNVRTIRLSTNGIVSTNEA